MKKIVSLTTIMLMTVGTSYAAGPRPSYITRTGNDTYNVTYDYKDKAKTGWYVDGHLAINFLNFKNKYSTNADIFPGNEKYASDDYSFESVFGGSIALGHRVKYFWRGEVELGHLGAFEDEDTGFKYSLSVPYAMANGYYDFTNGVYVGAGLGLAMPTTKIDGDVFTINEHKKTSLSPIIGASIGYATKLDDNLILDFRYRLSALTGHTQKRTFDVDSSTWFKNKNDFVVSNSLSVGLRYEF